MGWKNSKLRSLLKAALDRSGNKRFKNHLLQAIPFWVASLLTGVAAVAFAKLFSLAENTGKFVFHIASWYLFIVTPLAFLTAWWVVIKFAPYARGSGIPQVIAAIELAVPRFNAKVNKLLSFRIIIVKMISCFIMAFGGAIIGREGPTIQIAGSIFRKVNQALPAWWPKISKRNMIMAGAAAGLAAAFNTPLGGIVFAVEELTRTHISYFKTALFTAVIIAGLTAQGLMGPYLYLGYPDVSHLSGIIFFAVVLTGLSTGLMGSYMSEIILRLLKWKKRVFANRKQWIYVLICGLIIAFLAFFINHQLLGSGKDEMTTVLFTSSKNTDWYFPFLKAGGIIFSFTTGAAGGVFAPSLSAGAGAGAVIGEWLHLSPQNVNLLILSGMVGFLTGVTRTPFTSAILVLEMTDRHNVIFYLMLAGMTAGLAAILVSKHSFYDQLKTHYLLDLRHEDQMELSNSADTEEKLKADVDKTLPTV